MTTTRLTVADLSARLHSIPQLLERQLSESRTKEVHGKEVEHWDVVGIGASEAPARLLVSVLAELGLSSRYLPISSFHEPERLPSVQGRRGGLLIFSQGLSPNAQMAVRHVDRYRQGVLFTAVGPSSRPERQRIMEGFEGAVLAHGPKEEAGSLVRLVGPMAATLEALRWVVRLAESRGQELPWAASLSDIPDRYRAALFSEQAWGADPAACIAIGADLAMAGALMWKWQEALYAPLPPALDVLSFAHGPLQAFYDKPSLLVTLRREDRNTHRQLWSRFEQVLHPEHHRQVPLSATLPGPLAFFEYDAQLGAHLILEMEARGLEPGTWPAQGKDQPLYALSRSESG